MRPGWPAGTQSGGEVVERRAAEATGEQFQRDQDRISAELDDIRHLIA